MSDDVLSRIAHGEITPKPNIAELTERTVRFADGSEVAADVVVYCTGYKVTFPFLDPALISAPGNDLPLFRRVFHPDVGGIYFVGLLQPLGAIMPLAELQSQWICDHLAGRYHLPPPRELRADMEAERAAMFKRYVASKRHTMQVDFEDYVLGVRQERRRGERGRSGRRAAAVRRAPGAARDAVATGAASAPRRPTAPRWSPPRATRSASSASRPSACATSSAAPTSRRARSTTTSPTRRRSSARSSRRPARRRGAACSAARAGASDLPGFVAAGYRAYFAFIVEDPATFAFLRRNVGTLGTAGLEHVLPLGAAELEEDLARARGARRAARARPRLLRARDGRGRRRAGRAHGRARAAGRRGRDPLRHRAVPRAASRRA